MIEFIDTHIHLQDFKEDFTPSVLESPFTKKLVLVSASSADFLPVAKMVKHFPLKMVPAFGVHPWYAHDEFNEYYLRKYLEEFPEAIVGEIGVDELKRPVDEAQHALFDRQLEIAKELNRPVIVHAAKAFRALELHEWRLKEVKYVHHSFVKGDELLNFIINTGGYIGIGALFLKQARAKEMFLKMPIDRILFETDAPYQVDEADYINSVLGNLSRFSYITGINPEELATQLNNNAHQFFRQAR